jgi:predicted amidohydrolase YtcJ
VKQQEGNQLKIRHPLNWLAVPCLAVLGAAAPGDLPSARGRPSADVVILHAKVYTENPHQLWAEAVAVSAEKIVAVGTEQEIEVYRGARTQTIDAGGRVVLPGFTDSHIHFLEGSLSLGWPDLNGARSVPEIEKLLKPYVSPQSGKKWVFGQGWTYDAFGEKALPDKTLLDRLFPDRPVYLESFDSHTGWVNSKALALAGISRSTPDPPGGKIVRDVQTGEPTGALVEDARHLVKKLVPVPTLEEKLAALRKGLALANEYGLVRVHAAGETKDTFGDFYDVDVFDQLRRMSQLTVRFYISKIIEPPEVTPADVYALEQARAKYHDDWISVGAAKFFLDGVIEDHAAALLAPYLDAPGNLGTTQWAPEKYAQAVAELDRRGFQIFTHAVGDRAVRIALDAYQNAGQKNGTADARHRIEHVELVSPQDIPRFAALGVIPSMQPLHAYPEEGVWGRRTGPEREKFAFAWNSLEKAGAHLAFGSDWEVVTMNPWPGVQVAVTRQDDKGLPAGGWVPEQRISVSQTIAGYTTGAAYSGHRELTEGSLEPGKLADLIILSQNPFEVDPHELSKTQVVLTMVGGRVVYQRSGKFETKNKAGVNSQP